MKSLPYALRLAALERDRFRCTECGMNETLEVHHIISIGNGGEHLLENLRTLCRKCHKTLEPPAKVVNVGYIQDGLKNIKVSEDIHERLSRRGRYGQTMNQIIKELLDIVENKNKK